MFKMQTNSLLLIYNHPLSPSAPTILEHVLSFDKYSQFKVFAINTEMGLPSGIGGLRFACIVLHYSLFGTIPYRIPKSFEAYVQKSTGSLKVAFFQDEYRYCQERFAIVNALGVDLIYTLLDLPFAKEVYKKTNAKVLVHTLTSFVCDSLVEKARLFTVPFDRRAVDVGYRARPLDFYMGRGAQEKTEIAHRFSSAAVGSNLILDVKTAEADRIYGDDWYRFIANCRFMLGVEAGVSIFDLDGSITKAVLELVKRKPEVSFQDVHDQVLKDFEGNIPYRQISPRIFEAAAMRTGLILFEGLYNGVVSPYDHYIPLKKDFSNIGEVLRLMNDRSFVSAMVDRLYEDVISSGKYHYSKFVNNFDELLVSFGLNHSLSQDEIDGVESVLKKGEWVRRSVSMAKTLRYRSFPGRQIIIVTARGLGLLHGK